MRNTKRWTALKYVQKLERNRVIGIFM